MYYAYAECLLNKMDELQVLIDIFRPYVTEFFPKGTSHVYNDRNEYKIKDFTCYTGATKVYIRAVALLFI